MLEYLLKQIVSLVLGQLIEKEKSPNVKYLVRRRLMMEIVFGIAFDKRIISSFTK